MNNFPNNKLHIVAFDVPYPPDYGGAIDIFYKIKSLFEAGIEIYLHCYEYGRGISTELDKYCKKIWYYKRNTGILGLSVKLPYIVSSRNNKELIKNLINTDASILFEGVHTTFFLNDNKLKHRFKAIRVHNIEHEYYYQLYKAEKSILKKLYFLIESILLKKYEQNLVSAQAFFALSITDSAFFKNQYPNATHCFIPPFHKHNEVISIVGQGNFCLYHGNLSHIENIDAATFILKHIAPKIDIEIKIAGKNPHRTIIDLCNKTPNCKLVQNPKADEMEHLIKNAHIQILPTFQQSGMKLKLLNALFAGRHVVVNNKMLYGTGLNDICNIANTANEFIAIINNLKNKPFTEIDIEKRIYKLEQFSNTNGVQMFINAMFQI